MDPGIDNFFHGEGEILMCKFTLQYFKLMNFEPALLNKRPMGHIAHLRKQFKSINTYDYIKMLIKRRKKTLLTENLLDYSFEQT